MKHSAAGSLPRKGGKAEDKRLADDGQGAEVQDVWCRVLFIFRFLFLLQGFGEFLVPVETRWQEKNACEETSHLLVVGETPKRERRLRSIKSRFACGAEWCPSGFLKGFLLVFIFLSCDPFVVSHIWLQSLYIIETVDKKTKSAIAILIMMNGSDLIRMFLCPQRVGRNHENYPAGVGRGSDSWRTLWLIIMWTSLGWSK